MGNQIVMGAFGPKFCEQKVFENVERDLVDHYQRDSDAISRLFIRGFIPESQANKARDRLAKAMIKSIQQANSTRARQKTVENHE